MFKKILFFLSFIFLLTVPQRDIFAQNNSGINIYFFWSEGCPHCAKEKPFLKEIQDKYKNVKVYDFEVSKNSDNLKLLKKVGERLNADVSGVPFTIIGEKYFAGWYDAKSTGASIEEAIECARQDGCQDIVGEILNPIDTKNNSKEECDCKKDESHKEGSRIPEKIKFPFLGEIQIKNFSLPILTIVLGALDGFNPCAMWTLLFLISLLLGMEDRKRMWILGTTFIIASASVYFLFMAAWLNLLLFIGLVFWVRLVIGLIALGGGGYNLKEYFTNPEGSCKVTGGEKRQKVFQKLKDITHQKNFYLALGGIILLAFAVNLVELICSAGLPAVYTQILSLNNLSPWQYYLYVSLYIFIFMLDDLFIFFAAMITLKMTGITTKYSRWSHLIGGILMLIIGLLLIFKPGWLMFG